MSDEQTKERAEKVLKRMLNKPPKKKEKEQKKVELVSQPYQGCLSLVDFGLARGTNKADCM